MTFPSSAMVLSITAQKLKMTELQLFRMAISKAKNFYVKLYRWYSLEYERAVQISSLLCVKFLINKILVKYLKIYMVFDYLLVHILNEWSTCLQIMLFVDNT